MLRRFWKTRRSEQDFASEIESHLAIETDRLIAQGLSPENAQHEARKQFGNVTKQQEHFQESRTLLLETAWRHLRYAFRTLARRPAFAITTIVTLAFGIGANSALFTLLYSLLLRAPAVGDPAHYVNVMRQVRGENYSLMVKGRSSMLSWPDYQRLQQGTANLEHIAVYRAQSLSLESGERSVSVNGEFASCNYFTAARVSMSLGREFAAEECAARGAGSSVVLSHAYWQSRFGGDRAIIGRTLRINRQPFVVVGVAADGYGGITFTPADMWVPVTMYGTLFPANQSDFETDVSWLSAFGRLRPDASTAAAAAELTNLARAEDALRPGRKSTIRVTTGSQAVDPDDRQGILAATTAAVVVGGLVLLMCCANVMNLLLARASARRREIGIRLSLGASRARLIAQLMAESGVLAVAGGALGLAMAWYVPPLIRATAPDQNLNLVFTPDTVVIAATTAIALGSAILFGLIPALQSTNLQLTAAMRNDSGLGAVRISTSRWRNAAVVAQVSISALLLVTAAMFLRATQRSTTVNPGYEIATVSTVTFDLQEANYDSTRTRILLEQLRERLSTAPGVQSVAVTQVTPLRGQARTMVRVSRDGSVEGNLMNTLVNSVSPEYFETLRVPLVAGRTFAKRENSNPEAVIVSEAFANAAWPGASAIGKSFAEDVPGSRRSMTVIGVVPDLQTTSLGTDDGPYYYTSASRDFDVPKLLVRASIPPTQVHALATRITAEIDPALVVATRALQEDLQREIAPVKVASKVASVVGLVAMLLAAVGVYGVIAFAVSQRSREIGIRMALGATRRSVQAMMFRQGARVVGLGLAIGIVLAAGMSQAIRSILFGLSAVDTIAFVAVTVLLSLVATIAIGIPAARASRVDPVVSLRED